MIGLTYIRKLYGMSMQNVADNVGVSKQTVSKWESGKISAITDENLKKLSQLFGQDKQFFFKTLTSTEELRIQKQKLENELKTVEIPQVDEEGNQYTWSYTDVSELEQMDCLIRKQEVEDEFKDFINHVNVLSKMGQAVDKDKGEFGFDDLECISAVITILKQSKIETALLSIILNSIRDIDKGTVGGFGVEFEKSTKLGEEIIKLIRNYQDNKM